MPPTKKTLSPFLLSVIGIDLFGLVVVAVIVFFNPDYTLLHFGNGLLLFAGACLVLGAAIYVGATRDPREGPLGNTPINNTAENIQRYSKIMSSNMREAAIDFQRLGAAAVLPFIAGIIVRMLAGG